MTLTSIYAVLAALFLMAFLFALAAWQTTRKRYIALRDLHREEMARWPQAVDDAARQKIGIIEYEKKAFEDMKVEQDNIALWFRAHRSREIQMGRHSNRSFSDIVIGYLTELDELKKQPGSLKSKGAK